MSTRNYVIHASVFDEDGRAVGLFDRANRAGDVDPDSTTHYFESRDGLTDALRGLIDSIENDDVVVWSEDEEAAGRDRFVDGMIAYRVGGMIYVRRTIDAGGSGWSLVTDPMETVPDEQMVAWLEDEETCIEFVPPRVAK